MFADIELFLFSTDEEIIKSADTAGIDGFIVDWEDHLKFKRPIPSTQTLTTDSESDLIHVTSLTKRPVWCRINQYGDWTATEVEKAIKLGADLILLPMVTNPIEVEGFLSIIKGRVKAGILVETIEACSYAEQLALLPLDCVYVGLFDLSISLNNQDIFMPLTDGTVDRLRNIFINHHFGVGGLTTVDGGEPIPCIKLMNQLSKLGCNFTFLRNSFKRDIEGKNMKTELNNIRQAWRNLQE